MSLTRAVSKLPVKSLFSYGLMALPLAFIGLPVYLNAPKFYAESLGLSLSSIGAALVAVRLLDAIFDPLAGYYTDKYNTSKNSRHLLITLACPLLALGFYMLFVPPAEGQENLIWWFSLAMGIVYLAYSLINISLLALGAELSSDYNERTKISATREGIGLVGILLASILPQVLSDRYGASQGLYYFTLIFIPLVLTIALAFYLLSPRPELIQRSSSQENIFSAFFSILKNKKFRNLLYIYTFNGIAAAIPGVLVLFFIDDRINAHGHTGFFLIAYFLSGALGMPLWNFLAKRFSKKRAWLISMALSIITFSWAFFLKDNDVGEFYIICVLSGLCLGADLSLPPSILADISTESGDKAGKAGSYFGLWNLVTKVNMAIAAGISLPLLQYFGYRPGMNNTDGTLIYLSAIYALLPCGFKLIAFITLYLSQLDNKDIYEKNF